MDILIIGLGSIAAKHITALKQLPSQPSIYALRSGDSTEVEGVNNIYSLDELIHPPAFAIISNPTHLHLSTIQSLAGLSIPLFIEKPPLHTLTGAHEIVKLIEEKNVLTYVACNLRFHPCIKFLKSYFESNDRKINEVNVYCGSFLPSWRPGRDYREVYSSNKNMGGGVYLDLFHEIDYTCWLFGLPNASYGFQSNKSTLNINAADYSNYLFAYPGFNASIVLNYYRNTPKRSIEILFEMETWTVDLINNVIVSDTGGQIFKQENFTIMTTYIDQMNYFVTCLNTRTSPMNTFKESVEILKIALNNVSIEG